MLSEFEFIEKLKTGRSLKNSAVKIGIGDDCAVLPKDSKTDLVISTDLLVEEIDFRLAWSKPEFIGHKALAVSLSDIAAMGAKPVWSMLSIGIPKNIWQTDFVDGFYDGYLKLAKKFEVELIGGDVSKTPDKIVIDSIAAGEIKKNKAVLRSGAKAGDWIFVTGKLGGAAAGLKLLEQNPQNDFPRTGRHNNFMLKQLKPFPQVRIGETLSSTNLASSMIDLSDGLSSDLRHICRASQVGAKIFAEKIPFDKHLSSFARSFEETLNLALNGGEDFELLFTVNPKKIFQLEKALKTGQFSHIGEVTANVDIIHLMFNEKSSLLTPKGFRHF